MSGPVDTNNPDDYVSDMFDIGGTTVIANSYGNIEQIKNKIHYTIEFDDDNLPSVVEIIDKSKEPEMPSVSDQAKGLVKSTAKHVRSGFKVVDSEIFNRRKDMCNNCEFLTTSKRCSKCGCFMKVKARWETSKCPIGLW